MDAAYSVMPDGAVLRRGESIGYVAWSITERSWCAAYDDRFIGRCHTRQEAIAAVIDMDERFRSN